LRLSAIKEESHMKSLKVIMGALSLMILLSEPAFAYKIGERGQAPWHGSQYPAEIQKINGDQCFIHWYKENGTYDEWMACSLFKADAAPTAPGTTFAEGEAVSVEWKGSWWPAHVIAAKPGSWKIHYDGYDNSWDEWVGPARIKKK